MPSTTSPEKVHKIIESFLVSQGLAKSSPYTVNSGAALYYHKLRSKINDLDITVPELKTDSVQTKHKGYEIDAHKTLDNLRPGFTDRALIGSQKIGPLSIMSKAHILELKRLLNRPKDQEDIAKLSN